MSCGLMKLICKSCLNSQEIHQQNSSNNHLIDINEKISSNQSKHGKQVYSFKYDAFSKGYKNTKALLQHSKSIPSFSSPEQVRLNDGGHRNNVSMVRYSKSPIIRFQYSPRPLQKIENQSFVQARPVTFNRYYQSQVCKDISLISKVSGKKVINFELETQQSLKYSQLNSKFSPQSTETSNFHQEKPSIFSKLENPIIYQEQGEQSLINSKFNTKFCDQNGRNVQSQEAIRQKKNQQIMNFYNDPQTFQSIITSTEIKSRDQSQITNQVPYLKFLKEKPFQLHSLQSNNNVYSNNTSPRQFYKSPREFYGNPRECYRSPRQMYGSPRECYRSPRQHYISPYKQNRWLDYSHIDSNCFYSAKLQSSECQNVSVLNFNEENRQKTPIQTAKKYADAKISALNSIQQSQTSQNFEEEELRDVIDNTFIDSSLNGNTRLVSPFKTQQISLKNIKNEDKKVKHISFKSISPVVSPHKNPDDFSLFSKTRANLGRTDTIFSVQSNISENSCIDIKFMQRMRSKRGISKLISQIRQ